MKAILASDIKHFIFSIDSLCVRETMWRLTSCLYLKPADLDLHGFLNLEKSDANRELHRRNIVHLDFAK